ncbi:MAG: EamA family transporter [Zetaproteobacteria bacterium]|nr:EamA family transporter [Zetaproteobacteria bacterium]
MSQGYIVAVSSFVIFGLSPLYWHLLHPVHHEVIIFHRLLMSALLAGTATVWNSRQSIHNLLPSAGKRFIPVTSILCLSNWGLCIWTINQGYVLDASMAYFIAPLISIVLAAWRLGERLTANQKHSIAFLTTVICVRAFTAGESFGLLLSLGIAATFSLYGYVGKSITAPIYTRLFWECLVGLSVILSFKPHVVEGLFLYQPSHLAKLLMCTGPATLIPLGLYVWGTRLMPLSSLSILQYICPTLMFFLGWGYFQQETSWGDLTFYLGIWLGVAYYIFNPVHRWRTVRQTWVTPRA